MTLVAAKILIVDDNPGICGMLSLFLEGQGFQVFEAHSRAQALGLLQQESIDLVLLDMGMPPHEHSPEEGVAVLDWLAQYQPQVKVLVLTGQEKEATSYLAIKHGAFDYLAKPVNPDQLLLSIERAALFLKQSGRLKSQEGIQRFELDLSLGEGVKSARNQAEYKLVKQVLMDTDFNVHEVARRLGLKRENVYYLIKKYGLERQPSQSEPSNISNTSDTAAKGQD